MSYKEKKIGVGITTYKRLESLKICINKILQQSIDCDEIFVFVNGGNHETIDYLITLKNSYPQISCEFIEHNIGAAGGVNICIRQLYENKNDWIWILDDDCFPNSYALEKLIDCCENNHYKVANSLVMCNENELSFGLPVIINQKIKSVVFLQDEVKKVITDSNHFDSFANFFNGTLLHNTIIREIGFPNPSYFIWGEEVDYRQRIRRNGYLTPTVFNSIVIHPQKINLPPILYPLNNIWKVYYLYRNKLNLFKTDGSNNFFTAHYLFFKMYISEFITLLFSSISYKKQRLLLLLHSVLDAYTNKTGISIRYNPEMKW